MFVLIPLLITEVQQEFLAIGNFRERTVAPSAQWKIVQTLYSNGSKANICFCLNK